MTPLRWTLLVPVKTAGAAKSRLAATLPDSEGELHATLVDAMRADLLAAARATAQVARIIVVADDGDARYPGTVTIRQQSPGLNGALADGAAYAARNWPADGVAAIVGDLPALRPDELAAALDSAARHPRAFVPDAADTGTTMLTAGTGITLRPEFGVGSAARHARHAVALADAGPGLRRDVDIAADLAAALALGAGPATRAACEVVALAPLNVHVDTS